MGTILRIRKMIIIQFIINQSVLKENNIICLGNIVYINKLVRRIDCVVDSEIIQNLHFKNTFISICEPEFCINNTILHNMHTNQC